MTSTERNEDRTPRDVDLTAGANIRRLRKARNMSQEVLAEGIGLTFQQVQKYERGANRVSLSMLIEICKTLKCHPMDILPDPMAKNGADVVPLAHDAQSLYMRAPHLFEALVGLETKQLHALTKLIETFGPGESVIGAVVREAAE